MKLNEVNHPGAPDPRPAATVVLMRDSDRGLEVLVTLRPEHLRFMGGASVFPGGAVAEADLDPRWERASALTGTEAAEALGMEDPAAALGTYVAALREAFEEVGFLAASGSLALLQPDDADDARRFLERCLEAGVTLATDELVPAGRWVTPLGAPLRFDARFFLTRVSRGWEPRPDPSEVAGCDWLTPAEGLAALASGKRTMAPPTVEMLQRLDGYTSSAAAIEGFGSGASTGSGKLLSIRISPLVHVVLAPNAGVMTGPGTNTYVVGSGPHVVIDPAVDDPEFLEGVLNACGGEVASILITHRHPDHTGGAAALATETGAPVRAFGDRPAGDAAVESLSDGERIAISGAELVALHTPGHASDHLCFHMPGAASLFSGDVVLGEGTAVIAPPDGDMAAYLGTLHRLRELDIDRIYPGHWKPLDGGRAVIDAYIAHRKEREAKILAAVGAELTELDAIVAAAYSDTPTHMHPVARFSATAHLEMLATEGKVECHQDRWKLVTKR
jgi:glyoxylase-like metal-dependent hydrolase (beta-lactamase superfamily II)/8-oxo-dGTP pyrophosphatase MutT (NUDIX family)